MNTDLYCQYKLFNILSIIHTQISIYSLNQYIEHEHSTILKVLADDLGVNNFVQQGIGQEGVATGHPFSRDLNETEQ